MADINWLALETEYVTTNISYRKLAEKHGISFNTLKDHAVSGGWADKRRKSMNEMARTAQQRLIKAKATECVTQLKSLADSADIAVAMIAKIMEDAEQFRRHIVVESTDGDTRTEERIFDKYDTRAIKDFTGSLKDMVYVLRNLYGIPTITEQKSMEWAAQRLELERRRLEIEEMKAGGNDDDTDTGVVLLPNVIDVEPDQIVEVAADAAE